MITVSPDTDGSRLDRWLMQQTGANFVQVQKWLRTGQVRVDGKRAKPDLRLASGQTVRIPPMPGKSPDAAPPPDITPRTLTAAQERTLTDSILYRDDHLLILNKPYGLAVQGGSGTTQHLDDWLKVWGAGQGLTPRLTHRLDRDTSGVLAVALSRAAAASLTAAFRQREAEKTYWALVVGVPERPVGLINLPLSKSEQGGQEMMAVDPVHGKAAVTRYRVMERAGQRAAWLELLPEQGRTHQLRVHCAASGFPIQGDRKYGRREAFLTGTDLAPKLHLHARQLTLAHPLTGRRQSFIAPLPPHMQTSWELFDWKQD
jgi:23S rRNA pseudouridine955/2504/2580 synthase